MPVGGAASVGEVGGMARVGVSGEQYWWERMEVECDGRVRV